MKEFHVVHVVHYMTQTRGGRAFSALASALELHGVTSEFITLDSGCATARTTVVSETHISDSKRAIANLLDQSKSKKTIILQNNGVWRPINHWAVSLARRAAIPCVASPHGMLTPWAMMHKALKKKLAWWLYQRRDLNAASTLQVTSQLEASELRDLGLCRPIAIIPNGIEIPQWRKPGGRDRSVRTALFVSRIHKKKGILNLVEAWSMVRPPGWRMVIAGPDEGQRAEVEQRVRNTGLQDVFSFLGEVPEQAKWELYWNADLFILPTFSENFGVVVGESLACGVPVITTKAAPWQELETWRCGWWIDVGAEPLAQALRVATKATDEERASMGLRGRQLIEARYQWPAVAGSMRKLYEWVVERGPAPLDIEFA